MKFDPQIAVKQHRQLGALGGNRLGVGDGLLAFDRDNTIAPSHKPSAVRLAVRLPKQRKGYYLSPHRDCDINQMELRRNCGLGEKLEDHKPLRRPADAGESYAPRSVQSRCQPYLCDATHRRAARQGSTRETRP